MNRNDEAMVDAIDLSEFDPEFQRASSQAPRDTYQEEIPDGFYDARVEDVSLNRVQSSGNPMVIWRLRILGPQHQGRAISKVRIITQKTVGFLKEDLRKLGLEMSSLKELNGRMDEMVHRHIGIMKRTQPDRRWTDVHFVKPRPESAPRETRAPAELEDDLPF
ncbi:MAG: DUF669 domain-containing protein [Bryobacterales bacterium]|nr:DUF669 domain-containing protein [Bryobacterales bacterium]